MADDKDKKVVGGISGFSIIIGLMVLFSFWLTTHGPGAVNDASKSASSTAQSQKVAVTSKSSTKTSNNTASNQATDKNHSPYYGQVSIRASSVSIDSPNKEYLTLSARNNKTPINIGGWTLKNGRDKKIYIVSGTAVHGQSVSVKIPSQGVVLYNPYNPASNVQGPILLKSGEKAIIVTGSVPTFGSVTINENFKINRCLGYVEDHPIDQTRNYNFNPSLKYKCPTSRDLPSIDGLDDICYSFVRSISGCHQPTDIFDSKNGYCLDRNCKLSSYCQAFVKQNFNPQTCYQLYSTDEDFIGPEWRIYLNRSWELWEKQRETISLYDAKGLLVDEISY
ncbi:MAG: hypothetical protein WC531_03565 [Candidatus Paceibacterota bacterium]|jgi:hypothetical protein